MNIDGRAPDEAMSELPYEKGANFLRLLETHFGRPALDAFLQTYFDEHAFQSMTTPRLLELLRERLFQPDMAAWQALQVETWAYDTGLPDNMVILPSDHFNNTRAAAAAFVADGSLTRVQKDTWVTAEWFDFLKSLPRDMSPFS